MVDIDMLQVSSLGTLPGWVHDSVLLSFVCVCHEWDYIVGGWIQGVIGFLVAWFALSLVGHWTFKPNYNTKRFTFHHLLPPAMR